MVRGSLRRKQMLANRWPIFTQEVPTGTPSYIARIATESVSYCATLAWKIGVSQSFARERSKQAGRIHNVSPGVVASDHKTVQRIPYGSPKSRVVVNEEPGILAQYGCKQECTEKIVARVPCHLRTKSLPIACRTLSIAGVPIECLIQACARR